MFAQQRVEIGLVFYPWLAQLQKSFSSSSAYAHCYLCALAQCHTALPPSQLATLTQERGKGGERRGGVREAQGQR